MTESGLERSGKRLRVALPSAKRMFVRGCRGEKGAALQNEVGWREMTESGLERSGKRLRVALHATKWILKGGAGAETITMPMVVIMLAIMMMFSKIFLKSSTRYFLIFSFPFRAVQHCPK